MNLITKEQIGTMNEYYLITFDNTSTTIQAEGNLKAKNYDIKIMPTPTFITKSCGISIRVEPKDGENIKKILETGEIKFKGYFYKKDNSYNQLI